MTDRTASGAQQGRAGEAGRVARVLGIFTVPQYAPVPTLFGVVQVQHLAFHWSSARGFATSCARSAAGRAEQDCLGCGWFRPHTSLPLAHATFICQVHIQPHPTPPRPRPHPRPYPRPQDLPERISKAAVNLNYQCQLQLLDFSSRYNSPPVASILSPGERHRRLTAHIFLSFVPRSGAGYRSGTQGRSGQARESGTRQPWLEFVDYTPKRRWRLLQCYRTRPHGE